MMLLQLGFALLASCLTVVFSTPTTYDQRQTGDFNVQIHLKDLQVLALVDSDLLDDYTEYDYFYDYADFTVKPIVKPTTSPGTTVKPWNTWPTNPPSSSSSSTEKTDVTEIHDTLIQNSTAPSSLLEHTNENGTAHDTAVTSSSDNDKSEETSVVTTDTTILMSSPISDVATSHSDKTEDPTFLTDSLSTDSNLSVEDASSEKPVEQLSRKRCRSGFSPDAKGRCRRLNRRRLSFIPFAVKLGPKFLNSLSHNKERTPQ